MSELFLIAHLCRGEPTFDIAERQPCAICNGGGNHPASDVIEACVECDGTGHWWILSTPGYRAYPWWWVALNDVPDLELLFQHAAPFDPRTKPDGDWPDIFACNDRPSTTIAPTGARALLARLGLTAPSAPIKRRL